MEPVARGARNGCARVANLKIGQYTSGEKQAGQGGT